MSNDIRIEELKDEQAIISAINDDDFSNNISTIDLLRLSSKVEKKEEIFNDILIKLKNEKADLTKEAEEHIKNIFNFAKNNSNKLNKRVLAQFSTFVFNKFISDDAVKAEVANFLGRSEHVNISETIKRLLADRSIRTAFTLMNSLSELKDTTPLKQEEITNANDLFIENFLIILSDTDANVPEKIKDEYLKEIVENNWTCSNWHASEIFKKYTESKILSKEDKAKLFLFTKTNCQNISNCIPAALICDRENKEIDGGYTDLLIENYKDQCIINLSDILISLAKDVTLLKPFLDKNFDKIQINSNDIEPDIHRALIGCASRGFGGSFSSILEALKSKEITITYNKEFIINLSKALNKKNNDSAMILVFIIEKMRALPTSEKDAVIKEMAKDIELIGMLSSNLSKFVTETDSSENRNEINNLLKNLFANAYASDFELFNTLNYTTSKSSRRREKKKPAGSEPLIISNNDYFKKSTDNNGNSIQLDENTPIGYDILVPPDGKVNAVLFSVYGGSAKNTYTPYKATDEFKYLVENGVMVVHLNLVDLKELEEYQLNMNEDLHMRLHQSINHIFQIMKKNPKEISDKLDIPNNCSFVLEGASFGGRTAFRHAELYPGSFDGYISHDGAIDFEKQKKSDLPNINERNLRPGFDLSLDPSTPEHLENLRDPLLIMQNTDDNNVNAKVAHSFISKANKQGKGEYINFYPTKVGSTLDTSDSSSSIIKIISTKGHGVPDNLNEFKKYCDTMLSFALNPHVFTKKHNALMPFKSQYYKRESDKFYYNAKPQKKFIADAMKVFLKLKHSVDGVGKEQIWKNHYQPILDAHFYSDYICKAQPSVFDAEIVRIVSKLSSDTIEKILLDTKDEYFQFLYDTRKIEVHGQMRENLIRDNPALHDTFKKLLESLKNNKNSDKNIAQKILAAIYKQDPHLIQKGWQRNLNENYISDYNNTKNRFHGELQELQKKILTVPIHLISKKKELHFRFASAGQEKKKTRKITTSNPSSSNKSKNKNRPK